MGELDESECCELNPVISLGDLIRDKVSVADLVTAIKESGIYSYDKYRKFNLVTDPEEKERAIKLLEEFFRWSIDQYDPDYEDSRSPLELSELAETFDYEQFGWPRGAVPDFDVVAEVVTDSEDEDSSAERRPPRKFVGELLITIAEISKRANQQGLDFNPQSMPAPKEAFLNVLIKINKDVDITISTFNTYAKGICKFRRGRGGDREFYKTLFPEFFK